MPNLADNEPPRESSPVLVSAAASPDVSYEGDCNDHASPVDADPLLLPSKNATENSSRLSKDSFHAAVQKRFSAMLQYYVRFTASASNQDKLLKLMQWSLWIWNSLLVQRQARSSSTSLQRWVLKLYGEVSMARYVTRLLGFPVALEAAMHKSWTSTPHASNASSKLYRTVYTVMGNVLSYSMVGYHPMELMAYLLWMKPPPALDDSSTAPTRSQSSSTWRRTVPSAGTWSYLSCRCWLAYVVAEWVQCVIQWRELQQVQIQLKKANSASETVSTEVADLQAQMDHIVLQGVRDALFVVPCLQWSLPHWDTQPWQPVSTINTLMWLESLVCLYQAWRVHK